MTAATQTSAPSGVDVVDPAARGSLRDPSPRARAGRSPRPAVGDGFAAGLVPPAGVGARASILAGLGESTAGVSPTMLTVTTVSVTSLSATPNMP